MPAVGDCLGCVTKFTERVSQTTGLYSLGVQRLDIGLRVQQDWFLPDVKVSVFSHVLTRSSFCVCDLLASSRKSPSHAGSEPPSCAKSLSHVRLFATPWTAACQAPLSMGCSRQEYWSGLPFSLPVHLTDARMETSSLCLLHPQADSLPAESSDPLSSQGY